MNEVQGPPAATVVGNFQLNVQLVDGRTMAVSAYLLAEDTMETMNRRVELYHHVMEAHRLRCEIMHWEKTKEAAQKQIDDAASVLRDLQERARKKAKLTSSDQQTLENMPRTIAKLYENIPQMDKVIEDIRGKISKLVSVEG